MRRCARPGLFRTPSRSEDLLRAAAIKQRAQKTPVVGWAFVRLNSFVGLARPCHRFSMTGRRLAAMTTHNKFMHSSKSCRKIPKAGHNAHGKNASCGERAFDRSHAPRGNAAWDAPRPARQCKAQDQRRGDAERHGMHSHAERGNDHRRQARPDSTNNASNPIKSGTFATCSPTCTAASSSGHSGTST